MTRTLSGLGGVLALAAALLAAAPVLVTERAGGAERAELPAEAKTWRAWIAEMKAAPRGPFKRIRWFCKDGSILPPKAYACAEHGGGAQHGEWSDKTKALRAAGYAVANILADLEVEALLARPDGRREFEQILIEQFLIKADDGWILRQARSYRGALQEEGERAGARRLLLRLLKEPEAMTRRFLPLRIAARLLKHGAETSSVTEIRQVSAALAKRDQAFMPLRNKIHVRPDAGDAAAVRAYAAGVSEGELRLAYEKLAATIDAVYQAPPVASVLEALAEAAAGTPALAAAAAESAARLRAAQDPAARLAASGAALAALRVAAALPETPGLRLALLDASLALEAEHFVAGTALDAGLERETRRGRLALLRGAIAGAYGTGLISARQRGALEETLERLKGDQVALSAYKQATDYLGLVPGWAGRWLDFHFRESVDHFAVIEPQAELFLQDQLRGSPLFFYAEALGGLSQDANRLAGLRKELFGKDVGSALRSLNPGLARGRLHLAETGGEGFEAEGIYLLPETLADLPPVAGILTAGAGNPLSHVQLLARNLGIPNVALDQALIPGLKPFEGRRVVLAVSPAGSVRLAEDDGSLDALLEAAEGDRGVEIRPDLEKLDLEVREITPLSKLRAADSGRIVGPKAAKLGELRHHYPEAVAEGLAIPFGVFRRLLDQPYEDSGLSVFDWAVGEYRRIRKITVSDSRRASELEVFRRKLYLRVLEADPGPAFKARLRQAMKEVFGSENGQGVFVRSDTNVEDLPGFTGAGLNLTVPNAVGFAEILEAISRVWASPFTARAFAWRQSLMEQPEHVYPAVLLLRSVPAEKSGVLVTREIDSGAAGWISVAVNEGVGGAVDGQAAESLRIETEKGRVRLLAQATAASKRRINPKGGVDKVAASGSDRVLSEDEITVLRRFAQELPQRFPPIADAQGRPAPADVEFGFLKGKLQLFQIRPFLESAAGRGRDYLKSLDAAAGKRADRQVALDEVPSEDER